MKSALSFQPSWRKNLSALCGSVCLLALPVTALAHDFWIQPNSFHVDKQQPVSLNLQVGHGTARQKSLIMADRVVRFDSTSHAGHSDLRKNMHLGDANADTVLRFSSTGLKLLGFVTNGTYSELPDIRFNDYARAEGLTPVLAYRDKMKTTDQPGRETYSRRAKSLIQIGPYAPSDDAIAKKALGLTLEIVPDANPYAPDFKGTLPVHILFHGKPLAGATVMLNNLDFDSRPVRTIVTDEMGRASFTVPHTGMWQLNVIWSTPIANDPKADFETVFSSLSFGFVPGSH